MFLVVLRYFIGIWLLCLTLSFCFSVFLYFSFAVSVSSMALQRQRGLAGDWVRMEGRTVERQRVQKNCCYFVCKHLQPQRGDGWMDRWMEEGGRERGRKGGRGKGGSSFYYWIIWNEFKYVMINWKYWNIISLKTHHSRH